MKNLTTTSACLVALVATTPVFAGGLAEPMVQTAPTAVMAAQASRPSTAWGGFYAGGQIGTVTAQGEQEFADGTVELSIDGSSHGLHVGYMHDLGGFVLGAELDYDALQFDEITTTFGGVTDTLDVDFQGHITRLKARLGYNAGRFLPYATGGVAMLEADSQEADGTFIGLGAAFKATESILIGSEVLQHRFDAAFGADQEIDATTLSLRASFRF